MRSLLKRCVKPILSLLIVCTIAVSFFGNAVICNAAGYSGSGTMADPYIVTNAEQLQNMRENLSAHYKLGNTIDLAGVDFKPIGRLDNKFTGSFVCELNEDNTPKYVIKNLSITVEATSYGAENKNKWEAALFGATDGATLMGIYVLDAKITNNNFGDNTGSVIYNDYMPGMDEMNSAILIGDASNTTVTNCATTGVIDTSSNHCGGLIGRALNCTIDNCYSTADVTTKGCWNAGGLIGTFWNSTVTSCFSTGNVQSGQSSASSFIGNCGSIGPTTMTGSGAGRITDCYTTGNATSSKEDSTNFAGMRGVDGLVIENCYATGFVTKTLSKNTEGKFTVNNCYTLSGNDSSMSGFASADMETIKANLTGSNWDTTGEMPVLVNIGIVQDVAVYVPQDNAQTGTSTTQSPSTTDKSGEVATMIEKLPDPDEDDAITMDCKDEVMEAYAAYEALTVGQKDDFSAELTAKLMKIRTKLSIPLAGDVTQRLKDLPEADKLEAKHVDTVLALWEDFSFLDETVQGELDPQLVEKLNAAYVYVQELQVTDTADDAEDGLTAFEIVLIVLCSVVILGAVIFDVFVGIKLLRKINGSHKRGGKKRGKYAKSE